MKVGNLLFLLVLLMPLSHGFELFADDASDEASAQSSHTSRKKKKKKKATRKVEESAEPEADVEPDINAERIVLTDDAHEPVSDASGPRKSLLQEADDLLAKLDQLLNEKAESIRQAAVNEHRQLDEDLDKFYQTTGSILGKAHVVVDKATVYVEQAVQQQSQKN